MRIHWGWCLRIIRVSERFAFMIASSRSATYTLAGIFMEVERSAGSLNLSNGQRGLYTM
jgi:hypothetical protein